MIKTGLEIFIENSDKYRNRRVALIANQTSVTEGLKYSWDVLKNKGIFIKRIFSPEHGLFATEQDQVAVRNQPSMGYEVVSLYGSSYDSLIPDRAYLSDIDLVLFDIQDVGSRYYTYVNTMALFMKEIDGMDIEFMVLDRPNPLNGISIEGPRLQEAYESFVGVLDVPVRHGMTAGELAMWYKSVHKLDTNLSLCLMQGWQRAMYYQDTGLPWIAPSPNMPTEYTAYLYPGMCLLEGTNLSEGRGTSLPFINIGAPFIEAEQFAKALNTLNLDGVYFRPVYFKPTSNKYAGQRVQGVSLHITDLKTYRAFASGVALTKTARDIYGKDFLFLKGVYEFNDSHLAFDLLTGSSAIRAMIEEGKSRHAILSSWMGEETEFAEERKEYLRY